MKFGIYHGIDSFHVAFKFATCSVEKFAQVVKMLHLKVLCDHSPAHSAVICEALIEQSILINSVSSLNEILTTTVV